MHETNNTAPRVLETLLELRHLRLVQAIALERSVSRAARRLHLSQPAVSHALRGLEDLLGSRLFHRERGGMRPTSEGEVVLRSARLVLEQVRDLQRELEGRPGGFAGEVSLTTQCYTAYHWLPALLREFRERHPQVHLTIAPEATRRPLEALREGALDVAIVHQESADPGLSFTPLFSDELVALVSPTHRLAGRSFLDPEDLRTEDLILHSDPRDSVVVRDFLEPAAVEPRRLMAMQLTEAVLEAVKAELGVTVMARWAVAPQLERGEVTAIRLGRGGQWRTWYAATRRDDRRNRLLAAVVDLLRREAGHAALEDEPAA